MFTQADLNQFTGTEAYHRWSALYPNFFLTDGAQFVAEEAKAFWLMDVIGSWQFEGRVAREYFQVWKIKVKDQTVLNRHFPNEPIHTRSAVVSCEDGNGNEVARQEIEYTDFPLTEFKLYAIYDDRHMVILLPSEY
jgi:hypothetical protein